MGSARIQWPLPGPLFCAFEIRGSVAALDDGLAAVAPDHLGLAGAGSAPVAAMMTTIAVVADADRNVGGRELDRGLRVVGGLGGCDESGDRREQSGGDGNSCKLGH